MKGFLIEQRIFFHYWFLSFSYIIQVQIKVTCSRTNILTVHYDGGYLPFLGLKLYLALNDCTRILFSVDDEGFASLTLRLLLFLFISVFFYSSFLYLFSCLLNNAPWCIYFVFHIISSYLVPVPLFKGHRGLLYRSVRLFINNTDIPVSRWIFLHFWLFCIESFVFLINFEELPPTFGKTGPQSDNQDSCGNLGKSLLF